MSKSADPAGHRKLGTTSLAFICGGAVLAIALWLGLHQSSRNEREITQQEWETLYSSDRASLPMYRTIPAARSAELTPAETPQSIGAPVWARSNSDNANSRYSSLREITAANVAQLEVAWTYHSRDGRGNIQANPVIVDGIMYAPTVGRNIVAIEGATGREVWRFKPGPDILGGKSQVYGPATRGLTYWAGNADAHPRLFFSANGYLIAVDARTGRLVPTFGSGGRAPSSKGAGVSSFLGSVAPVIDGEVIVAANQNIVEGFDIRTGRRLWTFNTLTYPVANPDADNGGNVWGGMAMDTGRGILYFAVGAPHASMVGIDRPGRNLYTNCIVALDAKTGRLIWYFQDIGHDIWDLDIPAPPNLVTVMREGRRVDAVAQVTKLGNTILVDRMTGQPLFPYRLRRAPLSTIPGERTSPYQPDLELPQPFTRQEFTSEQVTNISARAYNYVQGILDGASFGWFRPLELNRPSVFYGVHGGAEWTGSAFDPTTGILYVSANQIPWIIGLSRVEQSAAAVNSREPGARVYAENCAVCHGADRRGQGVAPSLVGVGQRPANAQIAHQIQFGGNGMPAISLSDRDRRDVIAFLLGSSDQAVQGGHQSGEGHSHSDYEITGFNRLLDEEGYPGSTPPWGTLSAIDLNIGKLAWQVPLGEYPELTARGIPRTGTENFGGAMVTAGGVVFCAGTRDRMIRAFDARTGRELWAYQLPFGGFAPPATYEVNGRQYVVIAATGGGKLGGDTGDAYVAFSLPRH